MKQVSITVRFALGDVVFLRHERKKLPGLVTALLVREDSVAYWISWADDRSEKEHQSLELTHEYEKPEEFDPDE